MNRRFMEWSKTDIDFIPPGEYIILRGLVCRKKK